VITGRGIVSCIGNAMDQVGAALREGKSGIRRVKEFADAGLRSEVAGIPDLAALPPVDRKLRRFMPDAALYAYHAACAAIAEAGVSELLAHPRTGLIVGSGASPSLEMADTVALAREHGARKVLPYVVPRLMGNSTSANLATAFGIQGASYSIVSACSTSAHCIGHAAELIQLGKLDRVIAGGADEVHWTTALMFDAMRALSSHFNHRPQAASRPYDTQRDGFVLAGGAGILVLEEMQSAIARGARPIADQGGTATYIGYSMGARFVLHLALANPELVHGIVTIGGTAGIDDDDQRAGRKRDDDALADRLERDGLEPFLEAWLAQPLFAGLSDEMQFRKERLENTIDGLAESLRQAGTGSQDPLWSRLARLDMPALIIAGSEDAKFSAEARRLVDAIGDNASIAVVEGAGHAAHLERPVAFQSVVRPWLAQHGL
jgi:2-succinyl-6-hydroxy-2,4-cyclohexadiene-1-carboxylate synthase